MRDMYRDYLGTGCKNGSGIFIETSQGKVIRLGICIENGTGYKNGSGIFIETYQGKVIRLD